MLGSGMIRHVIASIFAREPAVFPAEGSPTQAAQRLREAVKSSWIPTVFEESVFGSIEPERVVLRLYRPLVKNSFAPVFRGAFVVNEGRTVLEGAYSLPRFTQAFMCLWFGLIALFALIAPIAGAQQAVRANESIWVGLGAGLLFSVLSLGFAAIGAAALRGGKGLARSDAQRISRAVARALG